MTMSGFGIRAQNALTHQLLPLPEIGGAVSPIRQIDSRHRELALPAIGWLRHQQRLVRPVAVSASAVNASLRAMTLVEALQTPFEQREPMMPFQAAPVLAPAVDARGATAVFRKEADYWTVRYDGRVLRLRDLKGLRYLAPLLADPGRAIHVADLLAESGADIPGAGARIRALSDHGAELLDPKARDEYRRRLADLREQVGAAEADHDLGRLERLRAEMDFIARELSSAYGLGGRARRTADRCERMRKGVTNRIREAIARIRKEDETLALHLTNSLRLGVICVYQPERRVRWDVGFQSAQARGCDGSGV